MMNGLSLTKSPIILHCVGAFGEREWTVRQPHDGLPEPRRWEDGERRGGLHLGDQPGPAERLRQLALETIDLNKDPYFMKNHLGSYECKLCLTLHNNEGSYLAHTQGKKHQANLARRAAKEAKDSPAQPAPARDRVETKKFVKIGRPGYKVTKQRDPETGQQSLLYQIDYPEVVEGISPRHRFMSAYEQRVEPPDRRWQYLIFAAEPYENIAFKIPSREVDKSEGKFWTQWNRETKQFFLQFHFKLDPKQQPSVPPSGPPQSGPPSGPPPGPPRMPEPPPTWPLQGDPGGHPLRLGCTQACSIPEGLQGRGDPGIQTCPLGSTAHPEGSWVCPLVSKGVPLPPSPGRRPANLRDHRVGHPTCRDFHQVHLQGAHKEGRLVYPLVPPLLQGHLPQAYPHAYTNSTHLSKDVC
ncbi:Splicing factor 3A subunit 2 [Branchiostoma belcheri]|nr:Splicing factor 3A subunit 2 [Branchiostoma belcheri]